MAEYNPSKIIKDGNTYNFRDTTKIPLAGSNEISGSLIPSATETYNFGSPSYQWNNAYIKSLTINGVACGDILTHNVSEFVDVSSNQTISGVKTFSSNITIQGSYNGNEFSSNARTVLEFRANRDTANKSGIYLSKFRQNRAQGEMGYNDNHILTIDVLENEVRTNDLFRFTFKGWVNDVPTNAYLEPYNSNTQTFLGTASHKWADVGTNAINGINPGALSLPAVDYTTLDTTNFVLDGTTNNRLIVPYDCWLNIRMTSCESYAIKNAMNGISYYVTNASGDMHLTIPVPKDTNMSIITKCSTIELRAYKCLGNI